MPSLKPDWPNLLRNCCPKCGSDLIKKLRGSECSLNLCEFFIGADKLTALKVTLRRQQFSQKMSNAHKHRLAEA